MKNLLCFLFLLTIAAIALEPVHQWEFSKMTGKTLLDTGSAKVKWNYSSGMADSDGLHCPKGSYKFIVCPREKVDWKQMTVDVMFKLDSGLDKSRRTLFTYENKAWAQSYLRIRFNEKCQLEAIVEQRERDKVIRSFAVASEPQQIEVGEWHNVRLTLSSGGEGQLWLDARLVAASKNALCISDLDYSKQEWYPLICFGVDPANPQQKRDFLRGTIRSVRLWDSVVEPNPLFDVPLNESGRRDFSHVLVTVKGQGEPEWTCPFLVLDSEGAAAGSTVTADDKFIRSAGKACAVLDGDELVVTYKCAIAPDVDPKKVAGGTVWSGDAVEFFFRPNADTQEYFHYGAGINGATYLVRMLGPRAIDESFKSAVKVEVSDTPDEWQAVFRIPVAEIGFDKSAGNAYSCNFTRSGPAAGGLQTWGPLSTDFHKPECFPLMIVGSRKSYFLKHLDGVRARLASLKGKGGELYAKAEKGLVDLEGTISANGDDRSWFGRIDSSFANLENIFTSIALDGKPFVVWEPEDAGGNNLAISMLSKPVEKISITMPRNSLARRGLVFSNMTERPFLGQIKCFEKWPMQWSGKAFNHEPWNAFLDGIRFYEALPVMDSAQNIFYDPLAPLPMNTVLRASGNGTVPLWITVSSKGLEAGDYSGTIVVKGDYPGFGVQTIQLDVKVLPPDPNDYKCVNMNFTYMQRNGCHPNNVRFLAEHGLNTIFASLPVYPEMLEDGSIGPVGYEEFDKTLSICFDNGFDVKTCSLIFYMAMERKWCMLHDGKARFPYGTPQFEKAFKLFLQDMVRHLEDTFALRREQLIFYPCDEPGGAWNDAKSTMNIAWNAGNWIREAVPGTHRFIDPHPFGASRKKLDEETMDKIFSVFDIVMLYRPNNTLPDVIATARKHNCTIWTYGILDKVAHPVVFRRYFWQNLKDGIGSTAAFWHMEQHAGGDGFDSFDCSGYNAKNRSDYGTLYPDWNYGTILTGRRFNAWEDGYTDYRLAHLCINAAQNRPDKDAVLKKLQELFAKCSVGSLEEMENGRVELLNILSK